MHWKGCLLPLAFSLSVAVIGSWRLAVYDRAPSAQPALSDSSQAPLPDYGQAPPGTYPSCEDDPSLADLLLAEGRRLGITVKVGQPELPGKDATYRAESGRLGSVTIKQRPMSPEARCMLICHEFIHVLQHLQGDLRGVPPLGWTTEHPDTIPQEAEAYGHQQRAGYVLHLLLQTKKPDPSGK